jgi:small subunit ribosomal protein S16
MVVTEHTEGPRSNSFVERVGSYNPKTKATDINAERVKYWVSVGAQATGTVHNMLVSKGIISGKKVNVLSRRSMPKDEKAAEAPAA